MGRANAGVMASECMRHVEAGRLLYCRSNALCGWQHSVFQALARGMAGQARQGRKEHAHTHLQGQADADLHRCPQAEGGVVQAHQGAQRTLPPLRRCATGRPGQHLCRVGNWGSQEEVKGWRLGG